jgi:hypothetical protein
MYSYVRLKRGREKVVNVSLLRPCDSNSDAGCVLVPTLRTALYVGCGNIQKEKKY